VCVVEGAKLLFVWLLQIVTNSESGWVLLLLCVVIARVLQIVTNSESGWVVLLGGVNRIVERKARWFVGRKKKLKTILRKCIVK
jgi:hypothetical protein